MEIVFEILPESVVSIVTYTTACFSYTKISRNKSNISETAGWRTKCHTIDCAHNTFLLLQKHLTSGTELILIGLKIVPDEEHV